MSIEVNDLNGTVTMSLRDYEVLRDRNKKDANKQRFFLVEQKSLIWDKEE